MVGSGLTFQHLQAVHNNTVTGDHHAGQVAIFNTSLFGLYGLSNSLNLEWNLPYIHWRQYAVEHEDAHHRNESLSGLGDITLGLRGIIMNEAFGPGHRLFIDGLLILPTGKGYATNPFGAEADSVDHRHFAPGTGQVSASVGMEWWWRSEFPLVMGTSSQIKQPLTDSAIGFQPGTLIAVSFHSIYQFSTPRKWFPYFELEYRHNQPDRWDGLAAPNSGGKTLFVKFQVLYKMDDVGSMVFTAGFPLWQDLDGDQLSGIIFALTLRFDKSGS